MEVRPLIGKEKFVKKQKPCKNCEAFYLFGRDDWIRTSDP